MNFFEYFTLHFSRSPPFLVGKKKEQTKTTSAEKGPHTIFVLRRHQGRRCSNQEETETGF